AETEEEIDALLAEADQKGIAEVERVPGISPAEYMAIAIAAKDNDFMFIRFMSMRSDLPVTPRNGSVHRIVRRPPSVNSVTVFAKRIAFHSTSPSEPPRDR
ncbi:MAG: hypothetical protein AAFX06_27940, partial [Planctomycetota bacterium]